jgi:cell wall-associated NlpC family hydrolase
MGTPVRILKEDDGWLYIQMPDDYLGWTDAEVVGMTAGEYEEWAAKRKVIVTAEFGFVRSKRSAASQPVSDVVAGSLLALTGESGGYFEVAYADGRAGYLEKDHAQPFDRWLANAKDTPTTIVSTAHRFYGVPYLWGGTSSKGMDCSGFTKTVFFLNGVLLPRDASQQVNVGVPVSREDGMAAVEPGDLLFFGSPAREGRGERITHVAISLGGKRFIHTPGGAGVKTNSLDPADPDYSKYRESGFLHVRRVIGAGEEAGIRRLTSIPYYRGHER